jgi:hypothetical protein
MGMPRTFRECSGSKNEYINMRSMIDLIKKEVMVYRNYHHIGTPELSRAAKRRRLE